MVSYQVNAFGLRIWKDPGAASGGQPDASDITLYYHDGARVIEERNNAEAVTATYVWGVEIDCLLQMQRAGVKYWFHANPLDSNYLVTDNAGTNVERYGYEDYGKPSFWKWNPATSTWVPVAGTQIGNPYLFQGREYDPEAALGPAQPLGLYYFRARYQNPHEQGRFLSRDPLAADRLLNAYTFVRNNPSGFTDPSGLDEIPIRSVDQWRELFRRAFDFQIPGLCEGILKWMRFLVNAAVIKDTPGALAGAKEQVDALRGLYNRHCPPFGFPPLPEPPPVITPGTEPEGANGTEFAEPTGFPLPWPFGDRARAPQPFPVPVPVGPKGSSVAQGRGEPVDVTVVVVAGAAVAALGVAIAIALIEPSPFGEAGVAALIAWLRRMAMAGASAGP